METPWSLRSAGVTPDFYGTGRLPSGASSSPGSRRLLDAAREAALASTIRVLRARGTGLERVTSRTVDGHLTSVLRKLRLESRGELAAALEEGAPLPT